MELTFFSLLVETNLCIKTMNSSQNIILHSLMSITILLAIFGIITLWCLINGGVQIVEGGNFPKI